MSCHIACHYLKTLLAAACLLVSVEACMQTALQHVRLPSRILSTKWVKPTGSGCRCCQLCRRNPRCSSYSVSTVSGQCELYDRVGTYATVTFDYSRQWRYRVMPGRSGPSGFCRHDSDCQQQGEKCRGRVCTTLTSVGCYDIFRTLWYGMWRPGRWTKRPSIEKVLGWLNGREIPLMCKWHDTLLLSITQKRPLDENTFMHKEVSKEELARSWDWWTQDSYSFLIHEDYLRKAKPANVHDYLLLMQCTFLNQTGAKSFFVAFLQKIPRTEPVVGSAPRPAVGEITMRREVREQLPMNVTLLYRPATGPILLTINADDPTSDNGALVRRDGAQIKWASRKLTDCFITFT